MGGTVGKEVASGLREVALFSPDPDAGSWVRLVVVLPAAGVVEVCLGTDCPLVQIALWC